MNKALHTPLPWTLRPHGDANCCFIDQLNGKWLAVVLRQNGELTTDQQNANAAFIVTACNAFYELIEALKHSLAFAEHELELRLPSADSEYIGYAEKAVDTARAALAKTTGDAP